MVYLITLQEGHPQFLHRLFIIQYRPELILQIFLRAQSKLDFPGLYKYKVGRLVTSPHEPNLVWRRRGNFAFKRRKRQGNRLDFGLIEWYMSSTSTSWHTTQYYTTILSDLHRRLVWSHLDLNQFAIVNWDQASLSLLLPVRVRTEERWRWC